MLPLLVAAPLLLLEIDLLMLQRICELLCLRPWTFCQGKRMSVKELFRLLKSVWRRCDDGTVHDSASYVIVPAAATLASCSWWLYSWGLYSKSFQEKFALHGIESSHSHASRYVEIATKT